MTRIESPGWSAATIAVAPCFMIPALCHAISSTVAPRRLVWSSPSDEMPHTLGRRITFVESYSPPMPTSMMATSTRSAQKMLNASTVRNWK